MTARAAGEIALLDAATVRALRLRNLRRPPALTRKAKGADGLRGRRARCPGRGITQR